MNQGTPASAHREAAAIGIDVGGTKTLGVVVDREGAIVSQERRPTREGASAVIEMLAALASDLAVGCAATHDVSCRSGDSADPKRAG